MLNIEPNTNDTVPVRVRTRRTLLGNGEVEVASSVTCARRAAEVSLHACIACEHCNGLISMRAGRAAHVVCHDPGAASAGTVHLPSRLPTHDRGGPRQSAADYMPISAIMSSDVTCVRGDVSVEALAALLIERGISGVPVVDAAGAPIGVVSRADLVRERHESDDLLEFEPSTATAADEAATLGAGFHESRIVRRTVADIMVGMTFALPENATLSQASALMAYEGIHRVPVTCAEGKVVGIVSTLDILRWLAEQDGYLVRR